MVKVGNHTGIVYYVIGPEVRPLLQEYTCGIMGMTIPLYDPPPPPPPPSLSVGVD